MQSISCHSLVLRRSRRGVQLGTLLKPGGIFLLYATESDIFDQPRSYYVGSEKFDTLPLSKAFVLSALEKKGFCDINVKDFPASPEIRSLCHGLVGTMFFTAHKM